MNISNSSPGQNLLLFPVISSSANGITIHRGFHDPILEIIFYLFSQPIEEGNGNPFQYSCLENPMDGGGWQASVHGGVKSRTRLSYFAFTFPFLHWRRSQTRLSDFTFTFHFHELEKEMATYSSVLAWRIPGTGEPGGLPSLGLHRVGHD